MRGYIVASNASQTKSSFEASPTRRHTGLPPGEGGDTTGRNDRLVREAGLHLDHGL